MRNFTRMPTFVSIMVLCVFLSKPVSAETSLGGFSTDSITSNYKGVVALDLSLVSLAISTWGIAQWGWFQHSPVAKTEGWFGANTSSGGADKTGHFYMSYLLSEFFLWDFKRQGVNNPERKAALSAMAAMTLVEVCLLYTSDAADE